MCIPIVYSSSVSDYVASVLFCWECPLLINSLDSWIMAHIQMMYIQIQLFLWTFAEFSEVFVTEFF